MTPPPQPPFEKCIGKYVFNCFMQIISNHLHQDWRGPFNPVKLVEFLIYDLPKEPRKTQKKLRTRLYIILYSGREEKRTLFTKVFFFSLFFLFFIYLFFVFATTRQIRVRFDGHKPINKQLKRSRSTYTDRWFLFSMGF